MQKKTRKPLSVLLALALAISLFAAMPLTAGASGAADLADTINDYNAVHGGSGSLIATQTGDTVTVTGNVVGAQHGFDMVIDAGVTLVWKADYSTAELPGRAIRLYGDGVFRMESGSMITTCIEPLLTVYVSATGILTVEVSGGIMRNTFAGGTIDYFPGNGSIKVNGGTVSSASGNVIRTDGANTNVTVESGSVETSGAGTAIRTIGADSRITVSGGTVSSESGDAIVTEGVNSSVIVGSAGKVSCSGSAGVAISAKGGYSKITVSDSGAVSSANASAIKVEGINAIVEVSGSCNVQAPRNAIEVYGSNSSVSVSGGTVKSTGTETGDSAIYMDSGNGIASVTVTNGTVSAAGPEWSHAICADGGNAVIAISGGRLESVGKYGAIHIRSTASTVSVSGGFVFGYGADIVGEQNVIYMKSGSPAITDSAVVCAFSPPALAPTYNTGDDTNLKVSPSGATATWGKEGSFTGIVYKNGANEGFYPISGVSINAPAIATPTASPAGGTYNGEQTITLACATDEATIYYTTNGGNPTASSAKYTEPFKISEDTTLKAIAVKDGMTNSAIMTEEYKITTAGAGSMANFQPIASYIPGQFTDVNENMWYGYNRDGSVANAFEYGLMQGNSPTTFNPTGNITLAEAITVATRVHSFYTTGHQVEFTPVPGDPWYQGNVNYAIEHDIIGATAFNNYRREATRAEMAYIFSRALPASELASQNTVNSLPDMNSSTSYYDAILMMYKAGVVGGDAGTGAFRPGDNIIRAEAAAIITRVILPGTRISGKTYG